MDNLDTSFAHDVVVVFGELVDVLIKIDLMSLIIIALFAAFIIMFLKAVKSGRINWLDLIRKPSSGELSLTKVIQLFGGIVATWVIIKLSLVNNVSWDIFAIYLAYVGSIEGFSKFVAAKYGTINIGGKDDSSEDYGDYNPRFGYGGQSSRRTHYSSPSHGDGKPTREELPPDTGLSVGGKDEITEEDLLDEDVPSAPKTRPKRIKTAS